MIGVVAAVGDLATVLEFFELFKTPWERAVPGRRYSAILAADEASAGGCDADHVFVYNSVEACEDPAQTIRLNGPAEIHWRGSMLPIYGHLASFAGAGQLGALCGGRSIDCQARRGDQTIHRIGYDLFYEIRTLLTAGQPRDRAVHPTLDLHIALFRSALEEAGVPFVEVPPRPDGFDYICCLTHDLDFFGLRRHVFDHTMLGFLYRSTVGTFLDLLRGRRTFGEAFANWRAALALPFVLAGLLPDPWDPFSDYAAVEPPERSTFFVVPFKGQPGVGPSGSVAPKRAVPYQVSDISEPVSRARSRGSEIALHGLDAWRDRAAGDQERNAIASATGETGMGVRMHWLYFDHDSPKRLEAAGFSYDSTWGYNDAVGYRAGTSQVFRLTGTQNLLELPLSIMDSALLFPDRMDLRTSDAIRVCRSIINNAVRFGGTIVVNWHDRSLAPERLWTHCYRLLLGEIARNKAWFTTAQQAVEWYRWRRSIRFTSSEDGTVLSIAAAQRSPLLPGASLKRYNMSGTIGSLPFEGSFDDAFYAAPPYQHAEAVN